MINKVKELRVKILRTVTVYFFPLSFIEVQLIYNVVLISGVQQRESLIHTHISTFLLIDSIPYIGHYRILNRVPCSIE